MNRLVSTCRGGDAVALAVRVAHEQLVERRGRMTAHRFLLHVVDVGDRQRGRSSDGRARGDAEPHYHDTAAGAGRGLDPMTHTGRKVHKIKLLNRVAMIAVHQRAAAFEHHIHLLFGRITHRRARASRIHGHLAVPCDSPQCARVRSARAEKRFVPAGRGRYIGLLNLHAAYRLAQEGRVDPRLLRPGSGRHQNCHQQHVFSSAHAPILGDRTRRSPRFIGWTCR